MGDNSASTGRSRIVFPWGAVKFVPKRGLHFQTQFAQFGATWTQNATKIPCDLQIYEKNETLGVISSSIIIIGREWFLLGLIIKNTNNEPLSSVLCFYLCFCLCSLLSFFFLSSLSPTFFLFCSHRSITPPPCPCMLG